MAGLVEFGGGLLLALGFLTALGASLVASVMLVAVVAVHLKNGFFVTNSGYEYNLVLGAAALSLAFTGPGGLSTDALLGYAVGGTAWGLGAGVIAVIGAAVQLAQRRVAAGTERVATAA